MCFHPTTTVLATLNTTDFLYTCDGHLTDRGFATLIEPPQVGTSATTETKVSDEEIRRIKDEWDERQKERQRRAQEKGKAKAAESAGKDGDKNASKADEKEAGKDGERDASTESGTKKSTNKSPPPPPSPIPVPGSSAAAKATHQRYTLHRDVWSMRLAEHKKKRQSSAVKDVAPRLPMTPRGGIA